jgi:prepilin-type processing-associated H-X9-DG protein
MVALSDYDVTKDDDGDGDPHPELVYPFTLSGRWHNGSAVAVFCDGHAEAQKSNTWVLARARWNNDHAPH